MARRSSRRTASALDNNNGAGEEEQQQQQQRSSSIAAHVRDRQRAVAEREASRLARPEQRSASTLGHADRKKSAVSSTPFGIFSTSSGGNKKNQLHAYDETAWCGPFSVARQMIAQREEAKRLREAELEENAANAEQHPLDEAMEALEADRKRKAHPSLSWKSQGNTLLNNNAAADSASNNNNIYAKRQRRAELYSNKAVPSLFSLCVSFLVDNFECVESLGYVDTSIRTAITKDLVSINKLNGEAFETIVGNGNMEALELVDCSRITQEQLAVALQQKLLPTGLRYLVLDQCGRCFGPKVVQAIVDAADSKSHSELFALSVGGAYLIRDKDATQLLNAICKTVSSLEFKACSMLGVDFCASLANAYGSVSDQHCKLLELSLEDLALHQEGMEALLSKPCALKHLKSLSLKRLPGLNDEIAVRLLEMNQSGLEHLDLSENHSLTDVVLAAIRRHQAISSSSGGGSLRALALNGLKHLTAHGLEALFLHVPGMDAPPSLVSLELGGCHYEAVTDELIHLVLQASSSRSSGGLVRLNVQGATTVTDTSLEYLAAAVSSSSSGTTLQELNLSFCPNISDKGLGWLVDQCSDRLTKVDIWGCAQITEVFLDGHRRVNDPELFISGAWIKKKSVSSNLVKF